MKERKMSTSMFMQRNGIPRRMRARNRRVLRIFSA